MLLGGGSFLKLTGARESCFVFVSFSLRPFVPVAGPASSSGDQSTDKHSNYQVLFFPFLCMELYDWKLRENPSG